MFIAKIRGLLLMTVLSTTTGARADDHPQNDPNFPRYEDLGALRLALPIGWVGGLEPRVTIFHRRGGEEMAKYLGFNEQGSLIERRSGKIYQWSLADRSLKLVYENLQAMPLEVAASLRNPSAPIEYLLAANKPSQPTPHPVLPSERPVDPARAALFRDSNSVRTAVGGPMSTQQIAAPPGAHAAGMNATIGASISGFDAKVNGGVLTFTTKDGSTLTYKVVRSDNMTASPGGIAGAWFAADDAMMFNVLPNTEVVGSRLPDAINQAMKQTLQK